MKHDVTAQQQCADFYRTVATLLHCEAHGYHPFPHGRRTRWNNRQPGSGRFVGHGLVRYYGPAHIHVHLTSPPLQRLFHSREAALAAIAAAMEVNSRPGATRPAI
jgi:hypothetical protein